MTTGKLGSGRSVVVVNGSIALALVVLLAGVALIVRPPAPPGIAEFAPQASKPISKAPLGQAAQVETSPTPCAHPGGCTSPNPSGQPGPIGLPRPTKSAGVPSALQCYRWPDGSVTQTFDPQSPPCIASWPSQAKGNGGATSRGVTRSEIVVAIPRLSGSRLSESDPAGARAVESFFNTSYEFYGRRLRLVETAYTSGASPAAQRANALAAAKAGAFAALPRASEPAGFRKVYFDTLAAHRVMGVETQSNLEPSQALATRAPYLWSYAQPFDIQGSALGRFGCQTLRRNRAVAPDYAGRTRSFALLVPKNPNFGSPDVSPITTVLRSCSVQARVETYDGSSYTGNPVPMTQTMADLKADGVTTVLLISDTNGGGPPGPVFAAATSAQYRPEWVLAGEGTDETRPYALNDQADHQIFGLAPWSKHVPLSLEPWYRACRADTQPGPNSCLQITAPVYHGLLVLAAGIQAAGPRLTPGTFRDGLWSTTFPNPGAGTAPSYQATVSVPRGTYWMRQDYALVWWDGNRSNGRNQVRGAYCYVDRGKRYNARFPSSDAGFFTGSCD